MRVLISGGAGFIGSHLAEECVYRGHSVVLLDDLSSGRLENVSSLHSSPHVTFVQGSVLDRVLVRTCMEGCDLVVHLAAAVGVRFVTTYALETLKTNIHGTETILEAACAIPGIRVLVASSSEVYGNTPHLPFREDGPLGIGPAHKSRWGYACSKAMDEFLGLAMHRERGLRVTLVRFFNISGARQRADGGYGMVIPRFVQQAMQSEPLTIYGDGSQTRCFTHVLDCVHLLMELAAQDNSIGEIVNLGTRNEVSIQQLARIVQNTVHTHCGSVSIPLDEVFSTRFEDIQRRLPSLEKLHSLTAHRALRTTRDIVQDVYHSML